MSDSKIQNDLEINIWIHSILMILLAPLYLIYWLFTTNKLFKYSESNSPDYFTPIYIAGVLIGMIFLSLGIELSFSSQIGGILLSISVALVGVWVVYYFFLFSKIAEIVTNKKINYITSTILLMAFPIGEIYLQYILNNLGTKQNEEEGEDIKSLSEEETKVRDYINQHKSQYPSISLKKALLEAGISEDRVNYYLSKYYK